MFVDVVVVFWVVVDVFLVREIDWFVVVFVVLVEVEFYFLMVVFLC